MQLALQLVGDADSASVMALSDGSYAGLGGAGNGGPFLGAGANPAPLRGGLGPPPKDQIKTK